MLAYTAKRLLTLIPTLLAASILVFLFVHLIPGDPAAILLGDTATPEEVAQLSSEMGFDHPLYIQYFIWLSNVLKGDLGTSIFFGEPVLSVIGSGAETSILLASMTMIWIILIGLPIGILSATKHGTWIDQMTSSGAMLAASIPTFWLGLYLIMIFSVTLGWFPSSGFPSLSDHGGNYQFTISSTSKPDLGRAKHRFDYSVGPRLHARRFARGSCSHSPRERAASNAGSHQAHLPKRSNRCCCSVRLYLCCSDI